MAAEAKIQKEDDGTYLDDFITVRCHVCVWAGCFTCVFPPNPRCGMSSSQLRFVHEPTYNWL